MNDNLNTVCCNGCHKKQSYQDLSHEYYYNNIKVSYCNCYSSNLTDLKSGKPINDPSVIAILTQD